MDREFEHVMMWIVIGGGSMFLIAATLLFLAFRGFGKPGAGGTKHFVLIGGLIAFLILCCAALLVTSYE